MLNPGDTIGKFKIVRSLGSGGMADVYEAEDPSLDRRVAIKVLPPEMTRNKQLIQRFEKEVRAAASLNHHGIVTVFEVGEHEGLHYYTMRMLTGGDLRDRVEAGLSEIEALAILRELADAFAHAHSRGFVHRDVKPENVIFDAQGYPVLTDFGIAKAVDSGTRVTATGVSVGTPRYISPEQARGRQVDARADLYSLGVILYEMLTGKPPYDGEESLAVIFQHVTEPIPRLPEAHARLQPLVDALMAKDPDDRPESAEALIRLIDQYLPTQPTLTTSGAVGATQENPVVARMRTPQNLRTLAPGQPPNAQAETKGTQGDAPQQADADARQVAKEAEQAREKAAARAQDEAARRKAEAEAAEREAAERKAAEREAAEREAAAQRKADEARQAAERKRQQEQARREAEARRQQEEARRQAEEEQRRAEEAREAERQRSEEAARQQAEKKRKHEEAARREAERKRQEEAARKEAERQRREEAARAKAEAKRQAAEEARRKRQERERQRAEAAERKAVLRKQRAEERARRRAAVPPEVRRRRRLMAGGGLAAAATVVLAVVLWPEPRSGRLPELGTGPGPDTLAFTPPPPDPEGALRRDSMPPGATGLAIAPPLFEALPLIPAEDVERRRLEAERRERERREAAAARIERERGEATGAERRREQEEALLRELERQREEERQARLQVEREEAEQAAGAEGGSPEPAALDEPAEERTRDRDRDRVRRIPGF